MNAEFSIQTLTSGATMLSVKGDLTVQHSFAWREQLVSLHSTKGDLFISLKAIQAIDISAIQFLRAFNKECRNRKRHFTIQWPGDKSLNDLLNKTGVKQVFN
jgi:anti-anti-sigma regulatory factor